MIEHSRSMYVSYVHLLRARCTVSIYDCTDPTFALETVVCGRLRVDGGECKESTAV